MFAVPIQKRTLAVVSAVVISLGVSACDDSGLGPDLFDGLAEFARDISVSDFESIIDSGTARIEIHLDGDGLVASRVEVRESKNLNQPEEIRSRIIDVLVTDENSAVVLELGGLEVGFHSDTRFRKSDGTDIGLEPFVAHVREALDAEQSVAIRAKRLPAAAPQNPDDPEFVAGELRLLTETAEREIELNIDTDNLGRNDTPPPDGWIFVLGLEIEVRVSEGLTELGVERDDLTHADFEGTVRSVDVASQEATLENGSIVRVIDQTEIAFKAGDRHRLPDLSAVAEALAAGDTVFTAGEGAVESEDPLTIVAARVVFELDLATEGFEGLIASVDLENRTATLDNGIVVRLDDASRVRHEEGDRLRLATLEAVAEELATGREVLAHGEGAVENDEPLTILAFHVVFKRVIPIEDFRGQVEAVSLDAGTVTLVEGVVVRVDSETRFHLEDGIDRLLPSLEAVAEALDAGSEVFAAGEGEVESHEPLTILAFRVKFEVIIPVEDFRGRVEAVSLDAGTVTLVEGVVVRVDGETRFHQEDGTDRFLPSLAAVAEALEAGDQVFAAGEGKVESREPLTILAFHLKFEVVVPVEDFEGVVGSIDLDARTATLASGIVVKINDETTFRGKDGTEHLLSSLEAVLETLEAGKEVLAKGEGTVEGRDPLTIIALHVAFETVVEDFEAAVETVDLQNGSFTLAGGTVVRVKEDTVIDDAGNFSSLSAVADAINDGTNVAAIGAGTVARSGEQTILDAIRVKFVARP